MEKLCVNCKWARRHWFWQLCGMGWELASCEAPRNKTKNPVTGEIEYKFYRCCILLCVGDLGDCGIYGHWFEERR